MGADNSDQSSGQDGGQEVGGMCPPGSGNSLYGRLINQRGTPRELFMLYNGTSPFVCNDL